MANAESTCKSSSIESCLNVDFMRSLVKQYSELGQWTSALFWADAAAAAAGSGPDSASGDDIWLLASAMLARGELHRAAYAVTSRGLHRRHLLCLGVAMRANLAAKEPTAALSLLEECDQMLLEPRNNDQTHNRALGAVLVWQARALSALERREASADALAAALRADCACYEALDLLLDQHALTPRQECELIESLPISSQLSAAEGALVHAAYRERMHRYSPVPTSPIQDSESPTEASSASSASSVAGAVGGEGVVGRMQEAGAWRARRLAGAGAWRAALAALRDPWAAPPDRAACLLELRRSADLFAFAHTLVDAYPTRWCSWFAVGCYYYLIGKSELARRYLSKACSLEPSAGCVWLAYGHSFAADNEHDQAMAAYFKASQLMAGCHLPPLYVGVECSLLNNVAMCERFLARAAALHNTEERATEPADETEAENRSGWERIALVVRSPHVAHEAGAAAFLAGHHVAARDLWLRALAAARAQHGAGLPPRWAATLDALGHASRVLGAPREALRWHERALALRPGRAGTYAAMGLSLALVGREAEAARALHAALARDPDDVVSLALLDAIVDRLDAALTDEEIPQFPFPAASAAPPPAPAAAPGSAPAAAAADATNTSDMSMSFD